MRTSDIQKIEIWSGISASSGRADIGCRLDATLWRYPTKGDLRAGHGHAGGVVYLMWPRIRKELQDAAVEKGCEDVWAAFACRYGYTDRKT